ncbi:hypothetical protein RLIN73S_03553 [Rhodanobacter lindaniclasticus]
MSRAWIVRALIGWSGCLPGLSVSAQTGPSLPPTNLPGITVTAPYTSVHGGYLISGDFKVDPRMPSVVFPAQALVKDDILSIQPLRLADNEYLVLQECASADCREAHIVRVWNAAGATDPAGNSGNRLWIKHENKYFIWLKRFPWQASAISCAQCGIEFSAFRQQSPPLVLIPVGTLAAYNRTALRAAEVAAPVPVESQKHEGSTFVVTFQGGSTVRIKRMHAAGDTSRAEATPSPLPINP